MAVSQATQAGMHSKHADETHYCESRAQADALAEGFRANPTVRMVRVREWNNGTAARPLIEYNVKVWRK